MNEPSERGKAHILVIDDEPIVLKSALRLLKRDAFHVDVAESAHEGWQLIRSGAYDLVVTDLVMPGMSGIELLRRLSKLESRPATIMITGYATIKTAMEALRLGAFEYLAKPFARKEFESAVIRALRSRSPDFTDDSFPPDHGGDLYSLRDHSWVQVTRAGDAIVGFEAAFLKVVGMIAGVELPLIGEVVLQGRPCGALTSADGHAHSLWMPVGGTIVEINETIRRTPQIIKQDPYGEGWVLRLAPQNLEEELKNLLRSP